MYTQLTQEQREKAHSDLLHDNNLMYINLCLLRMMRYNYESMKSEYTHKLKQAIGEAIEYHDKVLTSKLKAALKPEDFKTTIDVLDDGKLIELMDMMPILLDLTLEAMQQYNDVLRKATYVIDETKKQ
jgi:hypothetical protein